VVGAPHVRFPTLSRNDGRSAAATIWTRRHGGERGLDRLPGVLKRSGLRANARSDLSAVCAQKALRLSIVARNNDADKTAETPALRAGVNLSPRNMWLGG
jgi:hypothetical protein